MNPTETILAIVDLAGAPLKGRTTLQKLAYFASVNGLSDISFRPHYYGPFSDEVSQTSGVLSALGLLTEKVIITNERSDGWLRSVSGDIRAYTYSLTREGREAAADVRSLHRAEWQSLERLVTTCRKETGLNPGILATAAKIHFIFTNDPDSVQSNETVKKAASEFGWKLSARDISRVGSLLTKLGLPSSPVTRRTATAPA